MKPLHVLPLIGIAISISVGASWALLQAHEDSTHEGSALIRELQTTQGDVRELRAEMKALHEIIRKAIHNSHL